MKKYNILSIIAFVLSICSVVIPFAGMFLTFVTVILLVIAKQNVRYVSEQNRHFIKASIFISCFGLFVWTFALLMTFLSYTNLSEGIVATISISAAVILTLVTIWFYNQPPAKPKKVCKQQAADRYNAYKERKELKKRESRDVVQYVIKNCPELFVIRCEAYVSKTWVAFDMLQKSPCIVHVYYPDPCDTLGVYTCTYISFERLQELANETSKELYEKYKGIDENSWQQFIKSQKVVDA